MNPIPPYFNNIIILEAKMTIKRWMYRGGHPKRLTKVINKGWAFIHSLGLFPNSMVTLEVVGRISGKPIRFPLAMVVMNGERYLVSMLGNEANWVRNVRAAGGKARLRHGKSEQVLLEEVDAGQRAPILKAYLQIAPGARPHIPIDIDAPISEFEKIAAKYPVFKVVSQG
jgi:deazaflavin-dependent oxidoreductase (nitroreductase family)